MPTPAPKSYWPALRAAASLNQLAYFERAAAHVLAGWLPKIAALDLKTELAQHLYHAMDRASQLRRRLYGLARTEAAELPIPQGWQALMAQLDAAPNAGLVIAGLYEVVFPRVIKLYKEHVANADPVGDSASLRLLAHALPELERETKWGRKIRETAHCAAAAEPFLGQLAALWETRTSGDHLPPAESLWQPLDRVPAVVRPQGMPRCEPGSLGLLPVDTLRDAQGIGMFLHADLDEEYTTLELIARNSYEHPRMPWQFHLDMARQVADEARHALLVSALLADRGFRYGDFPINTSSYDGLYEFSPCPSGSRKELLWRMLVRQTFMEGLALDSIANEVRKREQANQHDIARAFDYILRDEIFHAESGLRWCRELLGHDPRAVLQERYEAVTYFTTLAEAARAQFVENNLEKAMGELAAIEEGKRRRGGLPERPMNLTGRRQATFTHEDIQQVLGWGYATL